MITFQLFITILLVLLNGFFVAAEFAIVKVRASQLEIKAKSGSKFAPIAQAIVKDLDAYLAATQLGITLASLGLGWFGESVVAEIIIKAFSFLHVGITAELTHSIAVPIAFLFITIMHIVFGELAPKSLAIRNAEGVTLMIAGPLKLFHTIFRPFISFLNAIANAFLKLLGLPPVQGQGFHTAEELLLLIEQGKHTGAIEASEHDLIQNVFSFNERNVRQIMVPRTKIAALEIPMSNKELIDTVVKEGYSRMPVYSESIDNIIGVVYAKDLLAITKHKEEFAIKDILRPAYFVPETKKISDLLQDLKRDHIHMAIVLDEFGGTAGMVTLEDIIEELVGEIQDEYDEERPTVEKLSEVEYNVNAQSAIIDVNELLPIALPESDEYDTVSGYLNFIFEKIPNVGDTTKDGLYEFTILKKVKRMVQSVRLKVLPQQLAEKAEE